MHDEAELLDAQPQRLDDGAQRVADDDDGRVVVEEDEPAEPERRELRTPGGARTLAARRAREPEGATAFLHDADRTAEQEREEQDARVVGLRDGSGEVVVERARGSTSPRAAAAAARPSKCRAAAR